MPVLAIAGVDLVLLLVALAAVLVLGAFWVFGRVIENTLGHVPVVGGYLGHAFTHYLEVAILGIASGLDSVTHAFAHWVYSVAVGFWHVLYQLVATIADAKALATAAFNKAEAVGAAIPAEVAAGVGQAEQFAASTGEFVLGEAENLYNSAIVHADAVGAAVAGEAVNLFTQAENFAVAQASDVLSEATTLFGQAETYAGNLAGQVQSEAVTLFGQAEALAQGLADSVQSEAVRLFGEAEAYAGDVAALAEAGAIAGALSQVIPRVAAVEAQAAECLEPLCETVTPNAGQLGRLGNILHNLEDLAIDGVALALLVEAVSDPRGTATVVNTLVSDVGGPIMTGLRDLASI